MSFSLWTSAFAFVAIEGYVLLDQVAIGHASTMFMFGSACLVASVCVGIFAIVMAIGLAISAAFSDDEPTPQQSHHIQDAAAVSGAHIGPAPGVSLAVGRTSSRRPQQRRRIRTVAGEARKTSTRPMWIT